MDDRQGEAARHAVAGAVAAAASCVATCPLDVVKARLQHSPQLAGPAEALASAWAAGGVRALYRGLSASLVCYVPSWAIYFAVYRSAKSADMPPMPAAVAAGVASTIVTNPLWVVRARIVARPDPLYATLTAGFRDLVLDDAGRHPKSRRLPKLHGLFVGLGPSLLGVANVAIQIPLYENFKVQLTRAEVARSKRRAACKCVCCRRGVSTTNTTTNAEGAGANLHSLAKTTTTTHDETVAGEWQEPPSASVVLASIIAAKLLASTATYPHEVVRTRMQAGLSSIGMRASVASILRGSDGFVGSVRRLYRGLATNMLRTVPSAAVVFYVYENVAYFLDRHHRDTMMDHDDRAQKT